MASTVDTLAAKSVENTDAAASALAGFTNQLNNVYGEIQSTTKDAAAAKEASTLTQGLATQKAQQAALSQATALGTNPDAATFALNQIAAEYKTNNQRAQKFADNVAYAMDPHNILDDPLKYIGQLVLLDFNKEGQDSAERASARSRAEYTGLNNMTQEYAQTQLAIAQTATTDAVAQNAKVAAFELNRQAQTAQLEQLRTNSEQVMRALTLQNAPFEIERARMASANDAARLEMARKSAAKQDILAGIQISREARAEKKYQEAEAADQQQLDILNASAAARGVPLHFNTQKDLLLAYKSPELKGKIDALFEAGLTDVYYKAQGMGEPGIISLGNRPSTTLGLVTEAGAKVAPGQQPILNLIIGENQAIAGSPMAPKKKDEYNLILDKAVQDTAKKFYGNIELGGGKNIYAAPPLTTFLSDATFVRGAPFIATEVFKTDKDLSQQTVNFKGTVEQVVGAIKSGTLTLDQADSELKFLAAKVMATNNSLRQYDTTAGLPRMKNVNIPVFAGGPLTRMLTGSEPLLDLADDNKRRAYLTAQMASWIQPQIQQQATKTMQGTK